MDPNDYKSNVWGAIFVVLGMLCVGLGTLGLFLPLLPTTPFLLLAVYLFARSSRRWHDWLVSHKRLGPYIHAFRGNAKLTNSQKFRIATSFTILFGISLYLVPGSVIKAVLAACWLFWIVFIYRIKTARPAPECEPKKPPDPKEFHN